MFKHLILISKTSLGLPSRLPPTKKKILIYESNTVRLEKAGLAKPFNLESKAWAITDLSIMGAAEIDPSKTLPPPWMAH
jgi:hypothetical protein